MANITKAEVEKINGKCKNDWKFDTYYFMLHSGEKTLSKKIDIDETHFLKCQLYFSERYERFEKVGLEITLHIAYFTHTGGDFASSSGLGIFRTINYEKPRRSFADLEKLTEIIDDQYILDIYNSGNNKDKLLDNILLDESGWHLHEV